jgi:alkylation response protein AidB-like acyl-CoA dehydrogenase
MLEPTTAPLRTRIVRRQDYSLSDEQQQIKEVFGGLFEMECPTERVRAAEPSGFDADLWALVTNSGIVSMALPEAAGGDGASLVDLALVAEAHGRRIAPVPLIDSMVAARLLARAGAAEGFVQPIATGSRVATIALQEVADGERQLVGSGAVADLVVGVEGGVLVATESPPGEAVPNLADAPLAWRTLSGPSCNQTMLARGDDALELHDAAVLEWKVLMAATQTGLAQAALDLAIGYANERQAFGVPIGTFQAIAHPLVDVATGVEGARRLAMRAAWYLDNEPDLARPEVLMAFVYAGEVANRAASIGIHSLGGLGFTLESDMQLYFRRARGWTLVAGDPERDLQRLGDLLYVRPTTEGC